MNFERVWQNQDLTEGLREALTVAAEAVHSVIVDPPDGMRNVTEWAKQQACWNRVMRLGVVWPSSLNAELITSTQVRETRRTAAKDQKMLNGIEAQMIVVREGPDLWRAVRDWGQANGLLSPTDLGILDVAGSVPTKIPSEKQSQRVVAILQRLHQQGCQLGSDVL